MGPVSGERVPSPMRYIDVRSLSLTSMRGSLDQAGSSLVILDTGWGSPPWTGEVRTRVVEDMSGWSWIGSFESEVAQVLELSLHVVELLLGELARVFLGLSHQVPKDVDDEVGRRVEPGSFHYLLNPAVERAGDLDGDLGLAHRGVAGWLRVPLLRARDTPQTLRSYSARSVGLASCFSDEPNSLQVTGLFRFLRSGMADLL